MRGLFSRLIGKASGREVAPPPFTLQLPDGWVGGYGPVAYMEALLSYGRAHPECHDQVMELVRDTATDQGVAYLAAEACTGDAKLIVTESETPPELPLASALELFVRGNLEDLASRDDLLGEPTMTSVDIAGGDGRVIRWSWNQGASPSSFALYLIALGGCLWVLTFRSDAATARANEPIFLTIASSFRPTEAPVEEEPTLAAASYLERAMAFLGQGEFNRAIAESTRAVELDPTLALAFINRGHAHRKQGELDLAIADLTNAIELDPTLKSGFHNRGTAHLQQGQLDFAIADLTKAIELQPDFAFAYPDRAQALLERGDDRAALADAEKAIELEPRLASGYYVRGLVLAQLGRDDSALVDYSKAIELLPDYFDAMEARSRLYLRQKHAEAALADIGRLIEFAPEVPILYASRGAAKAIGGDRAGALADFDQARTMATDPVEISVIDDEQRDVGL
jgi:tetratricopeptide (TPR) repeat protein